LLGFTYLVAFLSIRVQLIGLIGKEGITPAKETLNDLEAYFEQVEEMKEINLRQLPEEEQKKAKEWKERIERIKMKIDPYLPLSKVLLFLKRFSRIPTLFWISSSDQFMTAVCHMGMVASTLLMIGVLPAPILIATMYLAYLSIFVVAEDFLSLQWDVLLLETGLLSFFLALSSYGFQIVHIFPSQAVEPSKLMVFLFQWLLFRLMFSSGVVKLSSCDPNWRNLSAMEYHYFTQPIPTPFSFFMHNLPKKIHQMETLATFGIELFLPFLLFSPLPLRFMAVAGITLLNVTISVTGNYGFFNLLTIILSTLVLDDSFWLQKVALSSFSFQTFAIPSFHWSILFTLPLFLTVMTISLELMNQAFRYPIIDVPDRINQLHKTVRPFLLANSYGLFAVMTTKRIELIIEGSNDDENWLPYEFKYKPGNISRRPPLIPGHMPRLDWQLWFCAFRKFPNISPWLVRFLEQLWKGNKNVIDLVEVNPFPDKPPKFLRVMSYDYTFTSTSEWTKSGQWWQRKLVGKYIPFTLMNPQYQTATSE